MRISWNAAASRFAGLILVTLFAVAVMLASSLRWFNGDNSGGGAAVSSADLLTAPAPVAVMLLVPEKLDVVHTYSGMIRPKDRYSLGFEVAGRVNWIMQNQRGETIDVGDEVRAGDVLARLDERILDARKREVAARLDLARDNLERSLQSRRVVRESVSEAELQRLRSEVAVLAAQLEVAEQQLADTTLRCPENVSRGVISRRHVELGETVNAHQVLFEVVTMDEVLLVVGIPESRLPEINRRRHDVRLNTLEAHRARELGAPIELDDADLNFTARVRQLGGDRFGVPWPPREGRVYRIGETADDRTGLFEVEILVDNRDRALRPGYIALADVVIDRIDGYSVPISSVQFRQRKANLFTAAADASQDNPSHVSHRARRHELRTYIEQQDKVIIPTQLPDAAAAPPLPADQLLAVVRGQHRLVDGRRLEIVEQPDR